MVDFGPNNVDFDFNATYEIEGRPGLAFRAVNWRMEQHPDPDWPGEYEELPDTDWVKGYFVGDDHPQFVEVSELRKLDADAFCQGCGQVGCGHDGRERD